MRASVDHDRDDHGSPCAGAGYNDIFGVDIGGGAEHIAGNGEELGQRYAVQVVRMRDRRAIDGAFFRHGQMYAFSNTELGNWSNFCVMNYDEAVLSGMDSNDDQFAELFRNESRALTENGVMNIPPVPLPKGKIICCEQNLRHYSRF